MHKCVNNTVGNVYHLEQMVDNFFPYSQKQLGFDKGATIVFQSDEDNAGRMLGKTAYYDPENLQIVLYTDGRHPKDILRSLSHELVHHAQNCRGDFTKDNPTYAGYAQKDPHLRDMEREAYEKGNLIFRDFEDLIKTGKINIEIDFSQSGEPKMSLKEWKNNEINTKLMKKWGLLNEKKFPDLTGDGKVTRADILQGRGVKLDKPEEDSEDGSVKEDLDEAHCGRTEDDLEEGLSDFLKKAITPRAKKEAEAKAKKAAEAKAKELAAQRQRDRERDEADVAYLAAYEKERRRRANKDSAEFYADLYDPRYGSGEAPGFPDGVRRQEEGASISFEGKTPKMISVHEAKQITRRILERVRKESK